MDFPKWAWLFMVLLLGACKSSTRPAWKAVDLGPGRCVAVNVNGVVLGTDDTSTFTVTKDHVRTKVPNEDGGITVGVAINTAGDIAGYHEDGASRTAALYAHGAWQPIPGISGASAAIGMDDHGQVVGFANASGMRAFLFATGKGVTPLPTPADLSSAAYLVSGKTVAGIVQTTHQTTHAFRANGAALQDLGTLGGDLSAALGINGAGEVVGAAQIADGGQHAFLIGAAKTQMTDLGLPPGSVESDARGIDDAHNVAINARGVDGGELHPWVSLGGGSTFVDLMPTDGAKRPFVGAHVSAMSSNGFIAGWGTPISTTVLPDGGLYTDPDPVHCILWEPGT